MSAFDTSIPKLGTYTTGASTAAASSSAGSGSIWGTLAANAGDTLIGFASLLSAAKGNSNAPTVNNYNPTPTSNPNNLMIMGIVGFVLVLILFIALKPKKQL